MRENIPQTKIASVNDTQYLRDNMPRYAEHRKAQTTLDIHGILALLYSEFIFQDKRAKFPFLYDIRHDFDRRRWTTEK